MAPRPAARTLSAIVAAVIVLAGAAQWRVSSRYHHRLPGARDWTSIPRYIVSDDQVWFLSLRAAFLPVHRPPDGGEALAPARSPAAGAFIADVGIGWKSLGHGRWMWRGTFIGSYPPPAQRTIGHGVWVAAGRGWTADPHDSRKWSFPGSFNGQGSPSPPGPQAGMLSAFAGTWAIDKKTLAGKTWTWHGEWTGELPIR